MALVYQTSTFHNMSNVFDYRKQPQTVIVILFSRAYFWLGCAAGIPFPLPNREEKEEQLFLRSIINAYLLSPNQCNLYEVFSILSLWQTTVKCPQVLFISTSTKRLCVYYANVKDAKVYTLSDSDVMYLQMV